MGTTSAVVDKVQNCELSPHDLRRQEMNAVVSRHFPSFYRQAIRHLGNASDAEDAVQDACFRLSGILRNSEGKHKCRHG
jgi:DNA-directed RNA polymerase specialized sigma24 family protein